MDYLHFHCSSSTERKMNAFPSNIVYFSLMIRLDKSKRLTFISKSMHTKINTNVDTHSTCIFTAAIFPKDQLLCGLILVIGVGCRETVKCFLEEIAVGVVNAELCRTKSAIWQPLSQANKQLQILKKGEKAYSGNNNNSKTRSSSWSLKRAWAYLYVVHKSTVIPGWM